MRKDIKLTVRNDFSRTHLQFEVIGDMAKPIGLWQISRSGSCTPKYQRPKVFWRIPINIPEKGFYMVQDYGSTYTNIFLTMIDGVN